MTRWLHLAYQIRYHRWGPWALDRWAVTIAWGAAAIALARWLARGRPGLPLWHWLVLGVLILLGAGLLLLRTWAARRDYSVFVPEAEPLSAEPRALEPADKIAVRATGRFSVEGCAVFFADLQAFWRTFATGEHAIMAIRPRSRFLLGQMRPEWLGMWYIFIPAEALEDVTPGVMVFGGARGPALRLGYRRTASDPDGRKTSRPVRETVTLMFEDEPARLRVWADLIAGRSI